MVDMAIGTYHKAVFYSDSKFFVLTGIKSQPYYFFEHKKEGIVMGCCCKIGFSSNSSYSVVNESDQQPCAASLLKFSKTPAGVLMSTGVSYMLCGTIMWGITFIPGLGNPALASVSRDLICVGAFQTLLALALKCANFGSGH